MIKEHPMTHEQLNKILVAAKKNLRDACMLTIAANHAIRCSELASLKTADINLIDRTIRIRRLKGSNTTVEEIFDWELEAITAWMDKKPVNELLFPSLRARALCRTSIYNIFRHYAELTFTPVASRAPHAMRHTLGQTLADGGMDIRRLQIIMGHKNINSTAQYFTYTQRDCDAAKKKIFANRGVAA